MITAIVRFPLRPGTTLEDAKTLFEGSAPKYRVATGLVRKYYLFGEDGTGGGVYLWESRDAWRAGARAQDRFHEPNHLAGVRRLRSHMGVRL